MSSCSAATATTRGSAQDRAHRQVGFFDRQPADQHDVGDAAGRQVGAFEAVAQARVGRSQVVAELAAERGQADLAAVGAWLTRAWETCSRSAIPLIRRALTARQWAAFDQIHGRRVGADAPRLLPWLLENADPQTTASVLATLPEPARAAYTTQWQPAHAALDRWCSRA
ncbi:hypothetical protein ABGB17_19175 [Sphaerisporangium sp. B11E5]|uniref:hypothetical protein n=1 Tax=Sphaerisporangium sp. B11E5 TaxID=3153563 RepID=UPI00325F5AE5